MQKPRLPVLAAIVVICVAVRLVPYVLNQFGLSIDPKTTVYPWNFSPMLPLCLFGAAYFADRRMAFLMPFVVWFVGDISIGLITGRWDWAFYPGQPAVYAATAVVIAAGCSLRKNRSWGAIALAGLGSATGFFIITNFASWAFGELYPLTWEGLITCYEMAIPFYRNSLISMTVFLPVLFSRIAVVEVSRESSPAVAVSAAG